METDSTNQQPAKELTLAGSPALPCSQLDISDIIEKAKQERLQFLTVQAKRKEIETKIEELQEELKKLPNVDSWFIPQWRIELDERINAAILSAENAAGDSTRPAPSTPDSK